MKIIVRDGLKEDVKDVFRLIRELAEYEKASHEVINSEEQLLKDGFGAQPKFFLKVATDENNNIFGIALYCPMYSTWKGSIMYLDDLVVDQNHRQKGIGKKLLDAVIKDSICRNIHQFRFHVLDWNTSAISFYEKYPFTFEDDWITVKLDQNNFKKL